jgi:hypothetical protein
MGADRKAAISPDGLIQSAATAIASPTKSLPQKTIAVAATKIPSPIPLPPKLDATKISPMPSTATTTTAAILLPTAEPGIPIASPLAAATALEPEAIGRLPSALIETHPAAIPLLDQTAAVAAAAALVYPAFEFTIFKINRISD